MSKKCPTCKGSKHTPYQINVKDEDAPDYKPIYGFKECKICKGKGKVKNES